MQNPDRDCDTRIERDPARSFDPTAKVRARCDVHGYVGELREYRSEAKRSAAAHKRGVAGARSRAARMQRNAEAAQQRARAAAAERGEAYLERRTDSHLRAVRVPSRSGDLTIGYVRTLGTDTHEAYDERMQRIETSGDAQQGLFYTRYNALRAVVGAFVAAVDTGTFNPKGV